MSLSLSFFLPFKIRPNITNLSFWRSYWPWVSELLKCPSLALPPIINCIGCPPPWMELQEFLLLFSLSSIPALQPILEVFCSVGLGSSVLPAAMCWGSLSCGSMCLFQFLMLWGMAPCWVVPRPHGSLHWASHPNGQSFFPLTHAMLCYVDLRAGCSCSPKPKGL